MVNLKLVNVIKFRGFYKTSNPFSPPLSYLWEISMKFYLIMKKRDRIRIKALLQKFRSAIEGCNLINLGHMGDHFTWSNKHEDNTFIKERLDKALANLIWKTCLQICQVESLRVRNSEHKPIMMSYFTNHNNNVKRMKLFRYEVCWNLENNY